jgi:hypothetical protein
MKMLTYRETLEQLQIALKRLNPKRLDGPGFVSHEGIMCACAALRVHLASPGAVSNSEAERKFYSAYDTLMEAPNRDAIYDIIMENGKFRTQSDTDRYDRMVLWVESQLEPV